MQRSSYLWIKFAKKQTKFSRIHYSLLFYSSLWSTPLLYCMYSNRDPFRGVFLKIRLILISTRVSLTKESCWWLKKSLWWKGKTQMNESHHLDRNNFTNDQEIKEKSLSSCRKISLILGSIFLNSGQNVFLGKTGDIKPTFQNNTDNFKTMHLARMSL